MFLLTSFLVVIYQEGNQYNMETFSLITCQSLWTKEFDLSSLMRGPKQDIKTFDNSIAVFRVNRVTLHVVSEVSMEVFDKSDKVRELMISTVSVDRGDSLPVGRRETYLPVSPVLVLLT